MKEKYLSWDSTAFPDGEYRLRITASDLPGNPPEEALTAQLESESVPDRQHAAAHHRTDGRAQRRELEVRWNAADALSVITKAEYSLDGGDWTVVAPVTKLSDSMELDYDLTLTDVAAGEHTIAVRVRMSTIISRRIRLWCGKHASPLRPAQLPAAMSDGKCWFIPRQAGSSRAMAAPPGRRIGRN